MVFSASSCRCKHLFLVTQRDKHDALHIHFALCDTVFNSSWNLRTRRCEVIRIGARDYVTQIASSKLMRNPVLGDRAFGYPDNVSNQTESMCVSTFEPIRCCCREGESTKYQGFKYLDVTGVAMVPYQNKDTPWTMISNGPLCRIIRTFFVAE